MRHTSLHIKGINRNIGSPDNDTGFCSELINLKDSNGVKVVIDKAVESANIPFTRIRLHRINKTVNHIGVQDDATGVKVVHFDPRSGKILYTFDTFSAGSDIHYTLLGNQVVISDRTAIKEYVHQFTGKYTRLYSGLDFDIKPEVTPDFYPNSSTLIYIPAPNEQQYLSSCRAEINKFEINNKNYCEGLFLYAFTLTLYDGTETGMYGLNMISTDYTEWQGNYNAFVSAARASMAGSGEIATSFFWNKFYQKFTIAITENITLLGKYKNLVKKVNLYVSAPISKMPITEDRVDISAIWEDSKVSVLDGIKINVLRSDESGLEKALLYKQKSWSFEDFCKGVGYTFEFGGDKQTTGATMEVYASDLDRAGKMYTYNKRVHFYDSKVRLNLKLGKLMHPRATGSVETTVIVKLRTSNSESVLRYDNILIGTTQPDMLLMPKLLLPEMVVFPDSRAYQMDIIIERSDIEGFAGRILSIPLVSSPAYNYAYCYCGEAFNGGTSLFDGTYPTLSNTYDETDVINVTESGNAIVFPVQHSYVFGGNITSVTVSTDDISNAQVGQYPLSVFTDNGVYALAQGDGAVLYSNIIPVTGDTCLNESIIPTRNGVVYIANDALYLLRGKNAQKMSLLLEGEPDTYIQNNPSFLKCCSNSLYNVLPFLSTVDFREYIKDATLSWVANTNELIVSNKAYTYSYVYDFTGNSWYKVTGTFEGIEDNLVLRPVEQTTINATPSTGKITVPIIHKEKTKTFDSICSADLTSSSSCGAGHTIALVIDGTQVASASFSQITRMPMILSVLCEKIGYLEDYDGTVYATADLSAKPIVVYNITTNSQMAAASFVASSQSVTIPDKAIGAKVQVTIGGYVFNSLFDENASVITLLNDIENKINATDDCPVSAQVVRNTINLTSKETGQLTNNINVSVSSTDNDYLYINATAMTGGRDISLEPLQYRNIINWATNTTGEDTMIHLHTRPISLEAKNTYKALKSITLNCLANLTGIHNLSLYTFASNNLIDWRCVSAAQRKDCSVSTIFSDRTAKAYKYFIFMIGGIVPDTTQLSDIILAIEDYATRKIR